MELFRSISYDKCRHIIIIVYLKRKIFIHLFSLSLPHTIKFRLLDVKFLIHTLLNERLCISMKERMQNNVF